MNEKQLQQAEDYSRTFLENIGVEYPYNRPLSQWAASDATKILSLSDPHCPCHSSKVMREVQAKHKDAGLVIVPGDVGDYYSKSRFKKKRHVNFRDEVKAIFYYLEWLATHWPVVKVMLGNHDSRPQKAFADILGMGNTDLLFLTELNLVQRVASYFDNVEVVGTQLTTEISLTHIYQVGDIVFTHGERSHAQKEKTLDVVSQYLHKWKTALRLKPYKVIAQGHNHQSMKTPEGDEFWFMLPTAADPYGYAFEYIFDTRMMGRPPAVGYSVFRQEQGETNFNDSDNIVLEWKLG